MNDQVVEKDHGQPGGHPVGQEQKKILVLVVVAALSDKGKDRPQYAQHQGGHPPLRKDRPDGGEIDGQDGKSAAVYVEYVGRDGAQRHGDHGENPQGIRQQIGNQVGGHEDGADRGQTDSEALYPHSRR